MTEGRDNRETKDRKTKGDRIDGRKVHRDKDGGDG